MLAVVIIFQIIGMELVGGKWRTISGVSFLFPVPLGYISVAGIAYVVREWRILQLAVTLPAISLLAAIWYKTTFSASALNCFGVET